MAGPIKKKVGRPSDYNEGVAKRILHDIKSTSMTLQEVCDSHADYPSPKTFYRWTDQQPGLFDEYIAAKKKQVQVYIDDSFDEMKQTFTNPLDFQMLKLKIEHIRWYAAKLVPRLYGADPQELENKIKNEVQAMLHDAMEKATKARERDY